MKMDNNCVHCGEDTSFGNGRFVNRIPSDNGYSCAKCMELDCDRCDKLIPLDEDITANQCGVEAFEDQAWRVHEECLTPTEQQQLMRGNNEN